MHFFEFFFFLIIGSIIFNYIDGTMFIQTSSWDDRRGPIGSDELKLFVDFFIGNKIWQSNAAFSSSIAMSGGIVSTRNYFLVIFLENDPRRLIIAAKIIGKPHLLLTCTMPMPRHESRNRFTRNCSRLCISARERFSPKSRIGQKDAPDSQN